MGYNSRFFNDEVQLVNYLNNNNIKKENIVAIYTDSKAHYLIWID